MSKSLLDLSGKVDSSLVSVFAAIATVAVDKGIRYFVVGATARDIILTYGYGIATRRATADIDLGVEVADWNEFQALKDGLIATGNFTSSHSAQRLTYQGIWPIDIVPFGPLEHENREISWPPDHSVKMNVQGFEDAYRNAQPVRLQAEPELDIPFATPAGLAVLKLIAWRDRSPEGRKDAGDLSFLMRHYLDAGNQERLPEEHPDLLESDDFDYELAGAQLLGRDMADIMADETRQVVAEILSHETDNPARYRLVEDMMASYAATDDAFEECLQLLMAMKAGIYDGQ